MEFVLPAQKFNILYLHCHDAGRYIEPYGHRVPAPSLQRLAEQGVMFRNAFAAAPTCSPSRAALLTGQSPHNAGMLGLAHYGWRLNDYRQHLIHSLHRAGYTSLLCGAQHITDFRRVRTGERIGYHRILRVSANDLRRTPSLRRGRRAPRTRRAGRWRRFSPRRGLRRLRPLRGVRRVPGAVSRRLTGGARVALDRSVAEVAADWLRSTAAVQRPFFLSVGMIMPHRTYAHARPRRHPAEDPRFIQPPVPLPDAPEVRRDMADYIASVRVMDMACGVVLDALEDSGLADHTLVIATTDHGIAFPLMKCNLTDHGLGVYLIMRGPGGFEGGRVIEGMVSQLDLYPTLCELLEIEPPPWLQGSSLMPLVRDEQDEIHDALYGEVTYHAAYEPMRSIRTRRWKYIRRFGPSRSQPVLRNIDSGHTKRYLMRHGLARRAVPAEYLFDLAFDPQEEDNLADDPRYAEVKRDLAARLEEWMARTTDPLLEGAVPPPQRRISRRRWMRTRPGSGQVVEAEEAIDGVFDRE
jgi:arylsulfatase A-like enzyme